MSNEFVTVTPIGFTDIATAASAQGATIDDQGSFINDSDQFCNGSNPRISDATLYKTLPPLQVQPSGEREFEIQMDNVVFSPDSVWGGDFYQFTSLIFTDNGYDFLADVANSRFGTAIQVGGINTETTNVDMVPGQSYDITFRFRDHTAGNSCLELWVNGALVVSISSVQSITSFDSIDRTLDGPLLWQVGGIEADGAFRRRGQVCHGESRFCDSWSSDKGVAPETFRIVSLDCDQSIWNETQ